MKAHDHSSAPNLMTIAVLTMILLLGANLATAAGFDRSQAAYDGLLKKIVTRQGRVDYSGLKADPRALDQYLDSAGTVARTRFDSWTESRQLAFLINLYNAATLKLIIDHYPVKSIKDIGGIFRGPWDQSFFKLFGSTTTLNHLEHEILRKQYQEPRIHMALVCAAKGCPPLRKEAYTAEKLEKQLEDQSSRYLASPAGLRIDRRKDVVYLSSIFKWYGGDFRNGYTPRQGFADLNPTERAVANFCSRHLSSGEADYLEKGGYAVKYLDYDWALNKQP